MPRSLVERDRCERIKKRAYLPNVDEYHSSSQALTDVALQDVLAVTSSKSKTLKHGYIADLTREGGISPCSLMLGLLYIQRLSHANPKYLKKLSSRDLFLVSMVIASKYMNDEGESEALTNTDWAQIGCKPKAVLDTQELGFLDALDWRLYVSMEEYYSFVTGIEGRIALSQAMMRGWMTYSDMATIWEASNMRETMLEASVQAGKVTFAGAAMYLVCIATLFAACHSVQVVSETWSAANTGVSIPSHFCGSESSVLFQDTMHNPPENTSYFPPSVFVGTQWQHDHSEARSWLKDLQLQGTNTSCCTHCNHRNCGPDFGCGRKGAIAHTRLMDRGWLWICGDCRNKNCSLTMRKEMEQIFDHVTTAKAESNGVADLGMELNSLGMGSCPNHSNHCSGERAKNPDHYCNNGANNSLLTDTAAKNSNLTTPFCFDEPSWNLGVPLQLLFAALGLLAAPLLGQGNPSTAV